MDLEREYVVIQRRKQDLTLILYRIENFRVHGVWKLQKNVSFNIASEASYVYILSRQKFIKNAKK